MPRIAFLLLGLALAAVPGAAAVKQEHVLALMNTGLDRPARLVALDARTLDEQVQGPTLPGWAFGLEYARSPDRGRLAIFPRPSDAADRLFVIDTRTLRIVNRIDVARPACSAAWPAPRRIVLVVATPPCYSGEHPLEQLVVDPVEGKVVARRPAVGTGAAFYTRGGRLRFRVLAGKRVRVVRSSGRYAYVGAEPVTGGVFDLRDGSRTAHVDGNLVWSLLAGERGP